MRKAYNLIFLLAGIPVLAGADDTLYDLGVSFPARSYSDFNSSSSSLGALDTIGSDAYKLLMPEKKTKSRSVTFLNDDSALRVGAEYGLTADGKNTTIDSIGMVLDTSEGPYGAAIGYRRSADKRNTVQGRLSFKSEDNNSLQLDLVAERSIPSADFNSEENTGTESTAFMVGAKYRFAPNAYVAGQFGTVGYGSLSDESVDAKDYSAFSLEAGYRLGEDSSLFISHTRKNFALDSTEADSDSNLFDENVNAIGFRYNW